MVLTWLDIVLLAILGLSALIGVWRGFVVEVMALLVWVAAFWFAAWLGPMAAGLFDPVVDSATARWALGCVLVFLLVLALGGLLTWLVRRLVKGTGLSGTDRTLGLAFGLLRGAAVASVLVLVAGFTPMPQERVWQDSALLPGFEEGARWLRDWLPETLAQHISFDAVESLLPALDGLLPPPLPQAPVPEEPVAADDPLS